MKEKLCLTIIAMFLILLACLTFGMNKSQAATDNYYYPTDEEMHGDYGTNKGLWGKVPDKINLNIKETEFAKAPELIKKELARILGRDDYKIELGEIYYRTDEKKYEVSLKFSYKYTLADKEEITEAFKDIEIGYSNSKDRNEKDKNTIESILTKTGTWFNIYLDREIKKDGTKGEYEGLKNISWNNIVLEKIKNDTGIVDNTISVVVEKLEKNTDNYSNSYGVYTLRLFKNNVYYKTIRGTVYEIAKIIVPDNIGNARENYFNYAKPIIEKMYKNKNAYVDELDKQNYVIKYNVGQFDEESSMSWNSNDSTTSYYFRPVKEYYKNGKLVNTKNEESYSVKVAKKNEYRGMTKAKLEKVDLKEISGKSYLIGKLYISETVEYKEGGYSTGITSVVTKEYNNTSKKEIHTFDTKMPVVTLVNEAGKSYKAEVTKGKDGLYEFKILVDTIGRQVEYKMFAETQDINNKSPYKLAKVEIDWRKFNNEQPEKVIVGSTNQNIDRR